MGNSLPENRQTGWDLLEFDEMKETCAKCPLSWDKGRGCIGTFGPSDSKLPEIAAKYDCPVTASVPDAAGSGKIFGTDCAQNLLKETSVLRIALPQEGKVMVRRYSGPVDRMEAVAKICLTQGCGFYFI